MKTIFNNLTIIDNIYKRLNVYLIIYPWIMYIFTFIFLLLFRLLFINQIVAEEVISKPENTPDEKLTKLQIAVICGISAVLGVIAYLKFGPSEPVTDIAVIDYQISNITVVLPAFIPQICLDFVTMCYDYVKFSTKLYTLPDDTLKPPIPFLKAVYLHLFSIEEYRNSLISLISAGKHNGIHIIQIIRSCQVDSKTLMDKQIFFNIGMVQTSLLLNDYKFNVISPFMHEIFTDISKYDALAIRYKQTAIPVSNSNTD